MTGTWKRRDCAVAILAIMAVVVLPRAARAQRSGVPLLVSADWVAERLHDRSLVVLHLDDEAAYDRGHVPGARFLGHMALVEDRAGVSHELPSLDRLEFVLEELGISDGDRIVLYGSPLSAARAFFTLEYAGLAGSVSILDGGLEDWRAAGHPVSTATPSVPRGSFTARPSARVVVSADWVVRRLDDERVTLIDARPTREVERGVIPGAHHLYWRDVMVDGRSAYLKPVTELRELLAATGQEPGDTVVAYCAIGMRASMLYFVGRYLGYETRMYDGSMNEWRQLPGKPVAR